MMRANISQKRLDAIREELGISKFQAACRTRVRTQVSLIKARRQHQRAKELLEYHRYRGHSANVQKYAAEVVFAETLIRTLERRIRRL